MENRDFPVETTPKQSRTCAAVGCTRKTRNASGFCFQHEDMAKLRPESRKHIAATPELFEDRLVTLMAEVNTCAADYMAECHALRRDLGMIRDIADRAVLIARTAGTRDVPKIFLAGGREIKTEHWLGAAARYLGGDKSALDWNTQPPEEK